MHCQMVWHAAVKSIKFWSITYSYREEQHPGLYRISSDDCNWRRPKPLDSGEITICKMEEDRSSYKIQLQIRNKDDYDIYYKRDGQRFDSEYTLKFVVETNYEYTVNVKPSLPLQSVSVQGSGVPVTDLSQENGSSTYSFSWSATKIDANKNKDRTKVQLLLQFQGGLTLIIPLQVKFYKSEDTTHLTWGTPLHQIDFECITKPGQSFIDINKTIFR